MDVITTNIANAILVIGALAFFVSVVTQVTKNVGFLVKIPTDLQVIVLSLISSIVAMFIYLQISNIVFVWYYVIVAIVLGFFVAFVDMFGWTKLMELYKRFVNPTDSVK